MVYSEALHNKVLVIEDDIWDEKEYGLKDSNGKTYRLVSETKDSNSTILLFIFGVFLIPVFGIYYLVTRKAINNIYIGLFLSFVLIFVSPYVYNTLLLLNITIEHGFIMINWS